MIVELLLAHRLAQLVGLGRREARHLHRDAHDLLLVDDRAVGLLEDGLEAVVVVGDLRACRACASTKSSTMPLPAGRGGRARRTATMSANVVGLRSFSSCAHARRLDLEDAVGVAALQQREGLRVVERDVVEVDARRRGCASIAAQRVGDDGERAQAEEVHLEQAEVGDGRALVLRDDRARPWCRA